MLDREKNKYSVDAGPHREKINIEDSAGPHREKINIFLFKCDLLHQLSL